MPERKKPVAQYDTLDVLLIYLLGYKQKVVRIQKDVFDYHSYWFSKQPLRCVSVQKITDKQGKQWVVLTCRNKQAIRNHLMKFFIAYDNGTVKTPYSKLHWIERDLFLNKLLNHHLLAGKKLVFNFSNKSEIFPYGSAACAFLCMTHSVYAATQQVNEMVRLADSSSSVLVRYVEKDTYGYITFRMPKGIAQTFLMAWFGYPFMNWRIRLFSRKASYKEHDISFASSGSKEKKLLNLLLKHNGRVSVTVASKELDMIKDKNGETRTKQNLENSLRGYADGIRKKAVEACKGSKDSVDFIISVQQGWVTMENDSPLT